MPPVTLYDSVGQALTGVKYVQDPDSLRLAKAEHDKIITEQGNIVRIQAAAGLQFSPRNSASPPAAKSGSYLATRTS